MVHCTALILHHVLANASALFYYDYFLTIADEIRLFWQHPRSLATALYLIIRYTSFISNSTSLVFNAPNYFYPKVIPAAKGCVEF